MISLTIRTDNPEAEIAIYDGDTQIVQETWHAHRTLAETLHSKIRTLLAQHGMTIENIQGVVVFKGPGSFTGLRIGITVANGLASALGVPVVGEMGDNWQEQGRTRLRARSSDVIVMPEYGAEVHITLPKH